LSFRAPILTVLALFAFAANSILARAALDGTSIDPVSFTLIRIASGALTLALWVRWMSNAPRVRGSWISALALFGYAILFSLAYVSLSAATGALLLFGAVQITMVGSAIASGQFPSRRQFLGLALAVAGLVWLLLPGLAAPPPLPAVMMMFAGLCWGVYTLRGRGSEDPLQATANHFLRAMVPATVLSIIAFSSLRIDRTGVLLAIGSGALASGAGYAVWYAALKTIGTHTAAVVQLSVPLLTAIAGVMLLAEPLTPRIAAAGAILLLGIALVVLRPAK